MQSLPHGKAGKSPGESQSSGGHWSVLRCSQAAKSPLTPHLMGWGYLACSPKALEFFLTPALSGTLLTPVFLNL